MGGFRKRSGSVRTGYYNGIFCGSTWELCWVIYNLDHNVKFTRFSKKLEYNGTIYYPDFLLADGKTIIEIKGPRADFDQVNRKTIVAENNGYIVNLLTEDKLQHIFRYIKDTYNIRKYYTLYDQYKPKYSYICSQCNSPISRDSKATTSQIFCTRKCAGIFRSNDKSTTDIDYENGKYKRTFAKDIALLIFADTRSLQDIADEYKTTKNTIWFIKQKKTYKWIHN